MTNGSVADIPGPWTHRRVAANGARFHVVEAGDGPMVLFLHGFPEFWWAWRHQLPTVAAAGFRAVAMDLRGFGGSDKTPRGYDPTTLAGDVAGVIRCLGARDAIVVGHGWGGYVGWSVATLFADQLRGLVAVAAPHPLVRLGQLASHRHRLPTLGLLLAAQTPMLPERKIMADDCAFVEHYLRKNAAPGSSFPDQETAQRYRAAMRLWPAPHCALEYARWLVRSRVRSDGRRFNAQLRRPLDAAVLQIFGALDPVVGLPTDSGAHLTADTLMEVVPGAGHFPHEESPDAFGKLLLDWLDRSPG